MKRNVKRHAVVQPLGQSYRYIPLTQNQNAIVDVEDFESLNRNNWCLWEGRNCRYAVRWEKRLIIRMHREIMGNSGPEIDHVDGDGINNKKSNLRACTHEENMHNSTRRVLNHHLRGANPVKGSKKSKWNSSIRYRGETIYLGTFSTEIEAHAAFRAKAIELRGEFTRLD